MNRVILFLFVSIIGCQANDMKKRENIVIGSDNVKVSYINFLPKKVDRVYLGENIEKLFKIIEISRRQSPHQLASKSKFGPQLYYKITEQEVEKFKGQLQGMKHVSTKGNHEWKNMLDRKHVVIENERLHMYIMYPFEPSSFIVSGIPFEKVQKGESIAVAFLKNWIDIQKSFEFK